MWALRLPAEGDSTLLVPLDAEQRSGQGVYEALDANGVVIYTGRTGDLASRLRAHSTQSEWWSFARSFRWTAVDTYADAVGLERAGIGSTYGAWNVSGTADLPTSGRMTVPSAMRVRLHDLYEPTSADFDNYIATARHLGWTLQSLADAIGITREAIRRRGNQGVVDLDLFIPSVPRLAPSEPKRWPRLSLQVCEQMRALQEKARLVRGPTPVDHPNRLASERLTELIVEAKMRGVRDREIAEAVGVSASAIQLRISRHGYRSTVPPSQSSYRPGSFMDQTRTHCRRGHEFSGDNVRFINGDPSRRVCRTCERMRTADYRERRGAA